MSERPASHWPHWPLLCDPAEKAEREADNSVKQLEYIDHLVSERRILELRESHVPSQRALRLGS